MGDAEEFDCDLCVIGGGSGGLAAAKEASKHGQRVILFDFVKPSSQGSKWGLGGTCVNVGCVPKKLMHYAGKAGPILHQDAEKFGWRFGLGERKIHHEWSELVQTVQNHVKMLNFGYRNGLRGAKVNYINALARLQSPNTISYTLKNEEKTLRTKYVLIATGGRPSLPSDVQGAKEFALTSDDIFSHKKSPGKTLVVGGSYIALECAGFLSELGYEVSVAVRSILLRGFDRQCSEKVGAMMAELGTKFLYRTLPSKIEKTEDDKLKVTLRAHDTGHEEADIFDTVLYAVGRSPDTRDLGLQQIGVKMDDNGFLICDNEQTNIPNIFAVGDILQGRPELTPVAIAAGERLARRLFAGSQEQMDYENVATTVFTPVEYGCVGLSEEDARDRYGAGDVECYLLEFSPLEIAAAHRRKHKNAYSDEMDADMSPPALSKLVVVKSLQEKVVGLHFVGPNAGEILQGFALAVKVGVKKSDFDSMVGIHPTDAESFATLSITRSSGEIFRAAGGCGGGKCG